MQASVDSANTDGQPMYLVDTFIWKGKAKYQKQWVDIFSWEEERMES